MIIDRTEGTPARQPDRIDAAHAAAARRALERSADGTRAVRGDPDRGDAVILSIEGRRLGRIGVAVSSAPGERPELVARLRAEIAAGTYRVDHASLGDALLDAGAI